MQPNSLLTLPFYLKSEHHAQGVHRIETAEDPDTRLAGGSVPQGRYAEDAVDGPDRTFV